HNPNVFYECGRRHETGKPSVQLIRNGEQLPFDVAGIRTITYDLSTTRGLRDIIVNIREYVKASEEKGYSTPTSGASPSSIAEALERIERQINRSGKISSGTSVAGAQDPLFALAMGPKEAIFNQLRQGNIQEAEDLFF